MNQEKFFEKLIPKERDIDLIAKQVNDNLISPDFLLEGMENSNARIKFGSLNTFVLISETNPVLIYPFFEKFVSYLDSKNKVFKLGSIKILCNLTAVDNKKKFDKNFDKIYSFITDPNMTTASNLAKGSVKVIKSKPYLEIKITNRLLKVSETKYKTTDCKNILIGQIIAAFQNVFDTISQKDMVLEFVNDNLNNQRESTRKKAENFVKKYGITNA